METLSYFALIYIASFCRQSNKKISFIGQDEADAEENDDFAKLKQLRDEDLSAGLFDPDKAIGTGSAIDPSLLIPSLEKVCSWHIFVQIAKWKEKKMGIVISCKKKRKKF